MFVKSFSEKNNLFYINKTFFQLTWYNAKIIATQSSTNCS